MSSLTTVCHESQTHQYLWLTHNAQYVYHGFVDSEDQCGKFLQGDGRSITHNRVGMVQLEGSIKICQKCTRSKGTC